MDVPHLDEAQAARTQFLLEELRSMHVSAYTSAEGAGTNALPPDKLAPAQGEPERKNTG